MLSCAYHNNASRYYTAWYLHIISHFHRKCFILARLDLGTFIATTMLAKSRDRMILESQLRLKNALQRHCKHTAYAWHWMYWKEDRMHLVTAFPFASWLLHTVQLTSSLGLTRLWRASFTTGWFTLLQALLVIMHQLFTEVFDEHW